MGSMIQKAADLEPSPLDLIEHVISDSGWPSDRQGDEELTFNIAGNWCEFHLWFSWRHDLGALHFSCAFDFRAPERMKPQVHTLLALLNEKLWIGHFDLWPDEGMVMYRHAMLLRGEATVNSRQVEDLIDIALNECERFYPALQFVLWGGKSPEDALASIMLETMGEA